MRKDNVILVKRKYSFFAYMRDYPLKPEVVAKIKEIIERELREISSYFICIGMWTVGVKLYKYGEKTKRVLDRIFEEVVPLIMDENNWMSTEEFRKWLFKIK